MATTLGALITIARDRILETLALVTPVSPVVGPQGTPGVVAYSYKVVALNATGHSPVSAAGSTATGNATLTGSNFNRLTWAAVQRASGYQIYRTVGGATQGLIATLGAVTTYDDIGAAGDSATAPTTNTSGTLGIFWSDSELLSIAILGAKDLWRAFIDLHQEHFFTVDETNVSLAANTGSLTGVPANVSRILLIDPRDTTSQGASRLMRFTPAERNSPEFRGALAMDPVEVTGERVIYYAVTGAGAPIGAPTIYVAPKTTGTVLLRVEYIPTLSGSLTADDNNPIPGESDAAIVAYTVAFALAKDAENKSPDPNWLAVYKTEKQSCLAASMPRQEQTPTVVKGVFDDLFGPGLSGDTWDEY